MKNLQKYLLRIILLAACSGLCLTLIIAIYTISIDPVFFYLNWRWSYLPDLILFFLPGFFICLIFGTPFLIITDNYFPKARCRYIFGGAIGALIIWIGMAMTGTAGTPFLALSSGPLNWPLAIVFMTVGAGTGGLYTLALWMIDKHKNQSKDVI